MTESDTGQNSAKAVPPPNLIIYHGNCPDGFTAAWVTQQAVHGASELYAAKYGDEPPYELARNRSVYVVDFSYPRAQLEQLFGECTFLMVLDHHKTAEAELRGLPYCVFDMDRSGAGLAWDTLMVDQPRPWIVNYVEDRDLWRFALPDSRTISLRVRLTPHEVEAYDALAAMDPAEIVNEGRGAKLYLDHYVRDAMRNVYELADVDGEGTDAACVNVSYTGVSDVLHDALEMGSTLLAIAWHLHPDGHLACSVRSVPSYDCSAFAKRLGGGGHAQASGFRIPVAHELAKRLLGGGCSYEL